MSSYEEYIEKRNRLEGEIVRLLTTARTASQSCHLDKALQAVKASGDLIETGAPPVTPADLATPEGEERGRLRLFLYDIRRIYLAGIPDALVEGCRSSSPVGYIRGEKP